MTHSVAEILKAMTIPNNPDASSQFTGLMIVVALFIVISIVVKNIPKIIKIISDRRLYNFIIEFKNITDEEKKLLERLAKKNKIEKKYELIILEGIYDKYTEREIINIETGFDSLNKKHGDIIKYRELREKLFGVRIK